MMTRSTKNRLPLVTLRSAVMLIGVALLAARPHLMAGSDSDSDQELDFPRPSQHVVTFPAATGSSSHGATLLHEVFARPWRMTNKRKRNHIQRSSMPVDSLLLGKEEVHSLQSRECWYCILGGNTMTRKGFSCTIVVTGTGVALHRKATEMHHLRASNIMLQNATDMLIGCFFWLILSHNTNSNLGVNKVAKNFLCRWTATHGNPAHICTDNRPTAWPSRHNPQQQTLFLITESAVHLCIPPGDTVFRRDTIANDVDRLCSGRHVLPRFPITVQPANNFEHIMLPGFHGSAFPKEKSLLVLFSLLIASLEVVSLIWMVSEERSFACSPGTINKSLEGTTVCSCLLQCSAPFQTPIWPVPTNTETKALGHHPSDLVKSLDYGLRRSVTKSILASLLFGCIFASDGAATATDLRSKILNGTESCFRYNWDENQFEMTCSVLVWSDQGYTSNDYISLDANEIFDGGRQYGHLPVIDLNGITDFEGLFKILGSVASFDQAPLIRNFDVRNGSTARNGGFIVQQRQKFFIVDSCSSSGDIGFGGGGS
eukprot:gb/GECG01001473.1/.p1 GENE.gb/GECG01001473.1/~~gb/GECG01001473.1/.p1  ORF type:complete len:542 (+),score=36.67 gb/GECG01001473.1/:1-1626(+)